MARIVPKLNLNKTPELVDNNSLIFAKNIRFNSNGLSADLGFDNLNLNLDGFTIVGVIPYNTKFYLLLNKGTISKIVCFDEASGALTPVNCNWNWSGGLDIDGICTINLNGDIILTIAESNVPNGVKVPLKVININESSINDDETLYTQSPRVPFINLEHVGNYKNVIPAGVYQFFIRYEIRKDFYTNWFPASKELFAGTKKSMRTYHGGLNYVDLTSDSDFSFKLAVHHLIDVSGFKSFQLGFIIAHDDEVYARAYKSYSLNTSTIYFDYDTESIEEIDVKDILESPYSLYNVGNVTSFKNKLYISNYIESDSNPDFKAFASSIDISLSTIANEYNITFNGREITIVTDSNVPYMTAITPNPLDGTEDTSAITIKNIVRKLLVDNGSFIVSGDVNGYIRDSYFGVNSYFYKWVTHESSGSESIDPINPPETGIYTLKYGVNSENTYSSSDIEDIIDKIVETVYAINLNNGRIVDSSYAGQLLFDVTYYKELESVGDDPMDYSKIVVNFVFNIKPEEVEKEETIRNEYTLIPHQGYNFYIHLVKANGEVTGGYLINSLEPIIVPEPVSILTDNEFPAIYPVFTFNSDIPEGYVACFISIAHVKNNVAHVFDIASVNGGNDTMGHCLELDTTLYTWLKDIQFVRGETVGTFDYRASYDNELLLTFGGAGECVFDNVLDPTITYGFAKMPYEANEEYINLIQCTPYIVIDTENPYDNYNSLNLPGYLCRVKKPRRDRGLLNYFSGSDIYIKNVDTSQGDASLSLTACDDDSNIWKNTLNSTEYTIYSNFNLNYLALEHEVNLTLTTKTVNSEKRTYTLLNVQSILLSEIYKLPSMYKSYTRKLYYPYDDYNTLTTFNNTIRSSRLEGDESKINMFKFSPTDYYNVPTDKGIIVNLVAVGDNILVHTQDSIYKFSGQNSLTAAGGEDVQMKESEPFDTGIQELFGSEFGYAGLASKKHQILSEFGYTFWDRDSGRIYLYTGNAQMKVLSDDISKLLRRYSINDIYLADDYYNNRIFICVYFTDNKIATLSYDFIVKSFISVHDFAFDNHFKTKTKCYFINNNTSVYKVGISEGSYGPFIITNNGVYPKHNTEDCVVDVIFNDRFESIKTLNVLQWICNKIESFDTQVNMAEETFTVDSYEDRYKGDYLRIYSDSCMTDKLNIGTRSNDERLIDNIAPFNAVPAVNSYKQVRYNLGKWTFNYFRNILNRNQNPTTPRTLGQDDTLLYGKYFVARFIFNRLNNFKFEDVTFNITNDYNI